jgi:hypothetical protein
VRRASEKQSQFAALRLPRRPRRDPVRRTAVRSLLRVGPRNDIRRAGTVNPARTVASGGAIVRNEPNLARPGAGARGNYAKRSQTWGNWGVWAKGIV